MRLRGRRVVGAERRSLNRNVYRLGRLIAGSGLWLGGFRVGDGAGNSLGGGDGSDWLDGSRSVAVRRSAEGGDGRGGQALRPVDADGGGALGESERGLRGSGGAVCVAGDDVAGVLAMVPG
jgi:hypothetical protein